jgi:hypothetical protein
LSQLSSTGRAKFNEAQRKRHKLVSSSSDDDSEPEGRRESADDDVVVADPVPEPAKPGSTKGTVPWSFVFPDSPGDELLPDVGLEPEMPETYRRDFFTTKVCFDFVPRITPL